MSLRNKQQGFTIVELLIVIIVIGILAGLVITTFTGIQQKGRNTERQTDIKQIHSMLEAYYAQNTKYPTFDQLNTETFRTANLKGLDKDALYDPNDKAHAEAAFKNTPTASFYSYQVVHHPATGSDVACDDADGTTTDCNKYTLTATNEGGGTFVKNSLN